MYIPRKTHVPSCTKPTKTGIPNSNSRNSRNIPNNTLFGKAEIDTVHSFSNWFKILLFINLVLITFIWTHYLLKWYHGRLTVCDSSEMSYLVHNYHFNKTVHQLDIYPFVESVQCLLTWAFFFYLVQHRHYTNMMISALQLSTSHFTSLTYSLFHSIALVFLFISYARACSIIMDLLLTITFIRNSYEEQRQKLRLHASVPRLTSYMFS